MVGTCLYPDGTTFTPSQAPLTNVTNTKLLCCQSSIQYAGAAVVPTISGINDGTQWSAYIKPGTGIVNNGIYSYYQSFAANARRAFDGSTGTQCWADSATSTGSAGVLVC